MGEEGLGGVGERQVFRTEWVKVWVSSSKLSPMKMREYEAQTYMSEATPSSAVEGLRPGP